MDWGIHNVRPETVMETALEIDAPALVRRIRRHFQVARFQEERLHWLLTAGKLQKGCPAKIAKGFVG